MSGAMLMLLGGSEMELVFRGTLIDCIYEILLHIA